MAKEAQAPETKPENAPAAASAKKPMDMKKLIMIGVPLFIVQLALVFFLATKFLAPSGASHEPAKETEKATEQKSEGESGKEGEGGASIFVVKDLIINPAGTNGTRYLLTTVGFEVSSPEAQKELEKKDMQVRDALNSVLGSKGLDELVNIEERPKLRDELSEKISEILKTGSLKNVYFSKFIIQ